MKPTTDVVVIGAGVVGISVALALQAAGRRVHVVDRAGVAAGAAAPPAGAVAVGG
ncbi:MAG: FAD-dependent oxidoreductase, partial [Pseudomonadota bacterium]